MDLGMCPYHIQMVQALTEKNKLLHIECCQILAEMANSCSDIHKLLAFRDEVTFHVIGHVSQYNTVF